MTVSRALNSSPGVSAVTRDRILVLAKKLGYRRNTAAVLLAGRRATRSVAFREYIAILVGVRKKEMEASWTYMGFVRGVESRAAELGYSVNLIWAAEPGWSAARTANFFRAHNIRGAIILPASAQGLPPEQLALCEGLACSVFGGLLREPDFHFACNDHFTTAAQAVRHAFALGYRRPGLAVLQRIDERTGRRFRGGFLAEQALLPPIDHIPVCQPSDFTPEPLVSWYRHWKPDVIITHNRRLNVAEWLRPLRVKVPRDLGWISLDVCPGDREVAGIDQRSPLVGAACLDLVFGQLQRGESGAPHSQKGVIIEGVWQDGESVGQRAPAG